MEVAREASACGFESPAITEVTFWQFHTISDPPKITCPADQVSHSRGIFYFNATAFDKQGETTITCNQPSGTMFNWTTTVTCTAFDKGANNDSCEFKIRIIDIKDPAINCTIDQITSIIPLVNYNQPIAVDDLSEPTVECFPVSGSTFAIGYTTVTCTARDDANNTANCSFVVNVFSEAPIIVCPVDQVYDTPRNVCYTVNATDIEGAVDITCDHLSGSWINDTRLIICSATDTTGNVATCQFEVVIDIKDPAINCTIDQITSIIPLVNYNEPIAVDDLSEPTVDCLPVSGSTFAIGYTTVMCTARDDANNTANCSFVVNVFSEAPIIVCPFDQVYDTPRNVYYTVNATDIEGAVDITCDHLSGSWLNDTRLIICSATDTTGNVAICQFEVVIDTEAPVITCHEDEIISTTPYVYYMNPTVTDDQSSHPSVSCRPESGSTFPVDDTQVVCTAIDEANNAASCSFVVTVLSYDDVFPPIITCPMDIISPSQSPEWEIPTATDDETKSPLVKCSADPDEEYPISSVNEITCTATDDANNVASCSFTISIATETSIEIVAITETVTEENVEDVTQQLDEYLEEVDSLEPVDVVVTSIALESITNLESADENVTQAVVSIVDSVVGTSDLNVPPKTTASILNSFEGQVDVIANAGENYTQVEKNLVLQTLRLNSDKLQNDVQFVVAGNGTDTGICGGNNCSGGQVAFSVALPISILKLSGEKDINISFVVYKNDNLFPSKSKSGESTTGTVLASTMYTADVLPAVFEDPVKLVFTAPENPSSSEYKCVYWNETMNEFGDWSSEGCTFTGVYENGWIKCECTHLTNFAVLIFPNSNESSFLNIVTYIGCSLSIVGLVITIITVLGSKSIRSRQPQKIMVNLCFSMLFLYIVFLFGVDTARQGTNGCITVAVLLHYFLLTTIAWTAVEAANMYYLIIRVFNPPTSTFMCVSSGLAWGLPWIPIIIMLSVDKHFYNNDKYCYINSTEKGALIGGIIAPISVVIFGNCIIFVLVVRQIFKNTQGKIADSSHKELRERLMNAVAISSLLGLTWIFGFLSFDHDGQVVFLVFFCIFNTFQGVAIFVLFCFLRNECRDVWKAWFKKCGIRKPKFLSYTYKGAQYVVNSGDEMSNVGSSEITQQTNAVFESESKFE